MTAFSKKYAFWQGLVKQELEAELGSVTNKKNLRSVSSINLQYC
jgi:hypothetical protein